MIPLNQLQILEGAVKRKYLKCQSTRIMTSSSLMLHLLANKLSILDDGRAGGGRTHRRASFLLEKPTEKLQQVP